MKKWVIVPAAVLLLLPAVVLWWEGGVRPANASPGRTSISRTQHIPSSAQPVAEFAPPAPAAPPVAAPRPDPISTWAQAPALKAAVDVTMANFSGRYSVIVQDLQTGERFTVNAQDRYHPASTIKLPVTLYALEQYRAGKLGWQDSIVYTEADFESPGGGAFETAPFGGVYPVENLVGRALRYSNNVAVNMLGRRLGWENIRTWTRSIGGDLYRRDDGTPEVTALSELGWWLHLDKVSRADPRPAELVLQPLREVAYNGRIAAGLPEGVNYLHKFGSYDGYYHDGGIVYTARPYVLVVLTGGAQEHEADSAIARLSAEVYKAMSAR